MVPGKERRPGTLYRHTLEGRKRRRSAVLFQAPFILQRLFTQEYRAVRRGRKFRKASRMIIVAVAEYDPVKAFQADPQLLGIVQINAALSGIK